MQWRIAWLVVLATSGLVSLGCNRAWSLAKAPPALTASIVGKSYQFRCDMLLVQRENPRWKAIVRDIPSNRPDPHRVTGYKVIGEVARGTRIRVEEVVKFRYDVGMAPSPIFFAFARIESGPHCSELVEMQEAGIYIAPSRAEKSGRDVLSIHVDESLLSPWPDSDVTNGASQCSS